MSLTTKLFTLAACILVSVQTHAQRVLTLDQCVYDARKVSPSYALAKTRYKTSYWSFRSYRAGILPQISLSAELPNYSGGIDRIVQPDGTEDFRNRAVAYEYLRLAIDQNVPFTGGTFSVTSDLQRIDNFEPTQSTQYVSVPLQLRYTQPVLLYNDFKWQRKIEPLRYEESQRQYIEDLEQIGTETSNLFFNALDAQIRYQVAELNLANQDTLYRISIGRYDLGKIAENDLLQIELSFLNAQNQLAEAQLDLETATQNLKRYLGIPLDEDILLTPPADVFQVNVPVEDALLYARTNQKQVLEFRRRRLEAEQAVARAKGNGGYRLSVNAGFGISEQGATLQEVYPGTQQQQFFAIGIGIPIVDWGRNKSNVRQAMANQELIEVSVEQDELAFEQEVYLQVMSFNMQNKRLKIAAKADTIAQKRYDVAKNRYLIGKISITDLNIAQNEKDQARRSYFSELRNYWNLYYTIRRLTHYDFINDSMIVYEDPE
jgi:outer membrane protein TolC